MATPDPPVRSVGGISIATRPRGCRLREAGAHPWAGFEAEEASTEAAIELSVVPGPEGIAVPGAPDFSTPSWSWWRLPGGGYRIAFFRRPGTPPPSLVSDPETRRVTYHANDTAPVLPGKLPEVWDPLRPPVDQLLLIQHLAHQEGLVVHAAGFALGGVGFVVPGASGAGKSTFSRLLAGAVPEATMLSDERVIVRRRLGGFEAWGTPWMGTERIARNLGARLGGLLFPVKSDVHAITPLAVRETLRRLLGTVACPHFDQERSGLVLATLERMVQSVPAFELRFARDPGVGALIQDLARRESRAA